MFASYVTSALRALKRDRFHAALNISGLAVSLAAALLIALYIQHELSYDDFFTKPDRVYRVEVTYQNKGQPVIHFNGSASPAKEALEAEFPDQLIATSLFREGDIVSAGDKHVREGIWFADSELFNVLDLPVIAGDADAALTEPGNVVISKSMALELFGTTDAIGKTLRLASDLDLRVSAIIADMPTNSHLPEIKILASKELPLSPTQHPWGKSWGNSLGPAYIRLKDGVRVEDVASRLRGMVDRRVPDDVKDFTTVSLSLRPLRDIHLFAGEGNYVSDSNATAVYALGGTAAFLILIACFNYINLMTARALLRIKEVGMRKILGGTTPQLIGQFMGETLATTLLAFALAIGLAALFLPVFATLVGRDLSFAALLSPGFLAFSIGLLVFVSLAAGVYPSLVLASSKPVKLFHSQQNSAGGRNLLRSLMVGVQFSLTVGLIIAAAVVFSQVTYLKNIDLGFQKEDILVVNFTPVMDEWQRGQTYRERLEQSPYIVNVSGANSPPRAGYESNSLLSKPGDPTHQNLAVQMANVGDAFFDVMGIQPIAGRVFSPEFSDTTGPAAKGEVHPGTLIISKSAVRYLGFKSPEDAVGSIVSGLLFGPADHKIIGVVPDIHFRLARAPQKPMAYYSAPAMFFSTLARVAPGGSQAALDYARKTWQEMFPEQPFSYSFLEDGIVRANADDDRQSKLFAFFTGLAIVVACLGLFGLASFVAARRTQEIAVRKVLGASTANVARLLLWDFAKPVLLANIVAWPIAWLLMRQWLDGFAYRVDLSPVFFVGASAMGLGIALLTVMSRTLKAAGTRPAAALKYE